MEWSVNLTRHEIANLSRRGPTSARCHVEKERSREEMRETDGRTARNDGTERKRTRGRVNDPCGAGKCDKKGKKARTHARFSAHNTGSRVRSCYLLYRNKAIRPSNKRVLRSQFNGDLPETVQRRLRGASGALRATRSN